MFSNLTVLDLDLAFDQESFGPQGKEMDFSDQFDGKLFKPYNKMDKMGKFCEFSTTQMAPVYTKQTAAIQKQAQAAAVDSLFVEEKDDLGFENVAGKVRGKQEIYAKGRDFKQSYQQKQAQAKKTAKDSALFAAAKFQAPQQTKKKQKYADNMARVNKANYSAPASQWQRRGIREPSLEVKPEWDVIMEFNHQRFQKLPGFEPGDLGIKATCGRIYEFDGAWDKARTKKPIKIPHFDGQTLSDDLFLDNTIQRLATDGIAQVFMTDVAAAAIMCSSKAVFSWDLVLKKIQNFVFIQKREEENILDWETLGETAQQDMQPLDIDGVNGARFIMKEAAVTQKDFQYFSQNRAKFTDMAEPIELEVEDQKYLMQGYNYHVWKINDSISVCIRSAVHSKLPSGDSCNLFVLPEWNEKRQPWSKDLDIMTAVMFTNEIHDNSCKFSRWTIQSILGGVKKMRFGFVQRNDTKGETHRLIGTFTQDTQSFLTQMNINLSNCWATLRDVVATVFDRKDPGEYLFIKEPQSVTYRLIKMTEEESEEEQDEDNDDENEGL